MDFQKHLQSDRDIRAPHSAQRRAIGAAPNAGTSSGVAVTQVCLNRNNVILIARLSAATRLCPGGFMSRIAILRLFLREMIEAAIEPETIVTLGAIATRLRSHFETLRRTPGHPLADLAMNLRRSMQPKGDCLPGWNGHGASVMGVAAAPEPTTLRLRTDEIVAIDNYRCDIRQASGLCISRSAILRATIESFAHAFQVQ